MSHRRNPALGRTDADGKHGRVPTRVPADFAIVAPTMTRSDLRDRYGVSKKVLARWLTEAGVESAVDPKFRRPGGARVARIVQSRAPVSRQASNADPLGLNFGGSGAMRIHARIAALAEENARRVPCLQCALTILPENMARHVEIVHDEEMAA